MTQIECLFSSQIKRDISKLRSQISHLEGLIQDKLTMMKKMVRSTMKEQKAKREKSQSKSRRSQSRSIHSCLSAGSFSSNSKSTNKASFIQENQPSVGFQS